MVLHPALPRSPVVRRNGRGIAILAALMLLGSLPAQAQWVWRDAAGRVTASDRPPPKEIAQRDILSRPAPVNPATRTATAPDAAASAPSGVPAGADSDVAPGGTAPTATLGREVEARRRAAEQERAVRERNEAARLAAQRAENCGRARGHLAALESGQRMARTNERGEREVLDDRGRAQEAQRARAVISSDCG